MPDAQVGFDLHAMWNGPSAAMKILILYFLAISLYTIVLASRVWFRLGLSSGSIIARIQKAIEGVRELHIVSLRDLSDSFPQRSPEGGLRHWRELDPQASRQAFVGAAREADSLFQVRAGV